MWRLVKEGLRIYRPTLLSAWTSSILGVGGVFAVLALVGVVDSRHAPSWAALVVPVYLLHASAVVGWIVIGTELSEHRLRLHALLPLPLSQLALAQLVLPAAMLILGLPLAHAASAVDQAILGARSLWLGHAMLDLIAAHLLLLLQLTLAVKEVIVLRDTVRWKPWIERPSAARPSRDPESRRQATGEAVANVIPSRVAAGTESHGLQAGAVLAVLGWFVVLLLVGADVVLGVPNSTLVLARGIRISAHIGNLAVCTAAAAALAVLTAAFTVTLFVHRTHVTR